MGLLAQNIQIFLFVQVVDVIHGENSNDNKEKKNDGEHRNLKSGPEIKVDFPVGERKYEKEKEN